MEQKVNSRKKLYNMLLVFTIVSSIERGLFLVHFSSAGASILISVHIVQFPWREAGDESGLGWRWSDFDSLKGVWVLLEKISLEKTLDAKSENIYYNYIFINYLWLCNVWVQLLYVARRLLNTACSMKEQTVSCSCGLFYTVGIILRLSVWRRRWWW